jgi:hypothetical protein
VRHLHLSVSAWNLGRPLARVSLWLLLKGQTRGLTWSLRSTAPGSVTRQEHADINAARNIRDRCTVLRDSGLPSTSPEARANEAAGKPLA